MSTMTMSPNGRVRKSLANEIDRLNQILDGLADGLNEAVAEAVKAAVQQAIQAALSEVLNSPAFIEQLREKVAAPAPAAVRAPIEIPMKPVVEAVKSAGKRVLSWIGKKVKAAVSLGHKCLQAVVNTGVKIVNKASQVVTVGRKKAMRGLDLASVFVMLALRLANRFRMPLLTALLMGVLIGVLAFVAGRLVAAVMTGLGGFITALGIQAGLWIRRILGLSPWIGNDGLMDSAS